MSTPQDHAVSHVFPRHRFVPRARPRDRDRRPRRRTPRAGHRTASLRPDRSGRPQRRPGPHGSARRHRRPGRAPGRRDDVEIFGRLDVVVNNAGYANTRRDRGRHRGGFPRQIETNLFDVVNVTIRAAIGALRIQGSGHIISSPPSAAASPLQASAPTRPRSEHSAASPPCSPRRSDRSASSSPCSNPAPPWRSWPVRAPRSVGRRRRTTSSDGRGRVERQQDSLPSVAGRRSRRWMHGQDLRDGLGGRHRTADRPRPRERRPRGRRPRAQRPARARGS